MKLYTKRGDNGYTDLLGGKRVPKDDWRVQAYGCVDELNAAIGLSLAGCDIDDLMAPLVTAQNRLFGLGAQLANPDPEQASQHRVMAEHIEELERQIDVVSEALPPLRSFILPGGTDLAARLHLARTACRKAERAVVTLSSHEPVDALVVMYLNRLADLLFALARQANRLAGVDDVLWMKQ